MTEHMISEGLLFRRVRESSITTAKKLGYSVNPSLPLLDSNLVVRERDEITDRILCLDAVVSVACGMDVQKTTEWLHKENIFVSLSSSERAFLSGTGSEVEMQSRVEALWAFAWIAGLVEKLDFSRPCENTLVTLVPDLKIQEPTDAFRRRLVLRSREQIIAQCDLAYCLHWAIQDALLNRRTPPGKLHPAYVIERRRALEWVLSAQDWDDVSLDT